MGPGFVETEYTFLLTEKVTAFLADHLHLWLLPPLAAATTAASALVPAMVEVKEELEELDEDLGFHFFDQSPKSNQFSQPYIQNKEINKGFLLLKINFKRRWPPLQRITDTKLSHKALN